MSTLNWTESCLIMSEGTLKTLRKQVGKL
ncbi:hypothetical protein CIB84_016891 [Bambusicola thoracicus]|uniref:Uncharacterized protein n=1 Tax=Bambusicola thoracicus TaxID=9083 RepID=A0A2P4S5J3_BAMTH|nr:hypothetical protein CIB84_016891 [Bambusicola thoracicus]